MITVWGRRSSSYVQATLWCLAELGLEFERIDAGLHHGVTNTPEYLAMNPSGQVPTLVDGSDPPLFESSAIIRYLASRYGSAPFWPDEIVARSQIDKWLDWANINVAAFFGNAVFWPLVRTTPAQINHAKIHRRLKRLNGALGIADGRLLQHDYLCGDAFTLADIQMGHCLYRYFNIDIPRPPFHGLESYFHRLAEREAYRQHVMVDYEELRVPM